MKSLLILSTLFTTTYGNGWMTKPAAIYFDNSGKSNYIMRVDAKSLFPGYIWDHSPDDNDLEYQRLVKNNGIVQPLKTFFDQRINGCPMNDLSVVVGTMNYTTMEFLNDQAHEGLVRTHSGPCEVWLDDILVFSDKNCAADYTSYPAQLPIDYSKCSKDTCLLSFYWCAMHEPFWQLFKHCVTISNKYVSQVNTFNTDGYIAPTSSPQFIPPTISPTTSTIPATAAPIQRCSIRTSTVSTTSPPISSGINAISNNYIVDGGLLPNTRGVDVGNNKITLNMQYSPRVYMLNGDNKYQMFNLVGKRMEFDVDISAIPCDYNLAIYFSEMKSDATSGNGYCDAQGQGYSCSEMDIFEGNVDAMHLTSHPCDYSGCDRGGVVAGTSLSGAGIIHVDTKFYASSGILTSIEQTLSWNGLSKTLYIPETNAYGGLKKMGESFNNGMVLVMSIWTAGNGGMSWLNGHCNSYTTDWSNIHGSFANLAIRDL